MTPKAAYTICTNNFLSRARTLVNSFRAFHPDFKFYICCIDPVEKEFSASYEGPFEIISLHDIEEPESFAWRAKYTTTEFSCALKPFVGLAILKKHPELEHLLYLDADLCFYAPMKELDQYHQRADILLTPHIMHPITKDEAIPGEQAYLITGTYNAGFLSLRISNHSRSFLQWWSDKCREACSYKMNEGLFVDQKWLNLVPVFFDKVEVIRHPGYNVSYWNLHERDLRKEAGCWTIDGQFPLVFFHFSSVNINKKQLFTPVQNRFTQQDLPQVQELFQQYCQWLMEQGYEQTHRAISSHHQLHQEYHNSKLRSSGRGLLKLLMRKILSESTRNKLRNRLSSFLNN